MFVLIWLVLLLIGGGVTLIAVQNFVQPVHLNVFLWQLPNLPVGVWLISAFLLGAMLLYSTDVLSAYSDRREIQALRQRIRDLEEEKATSSQSSNLSSPEPAAGDFQSSANTAPLMPMPGVNLPQVGGRGRVPFSPRRNFRQ